MPLLLLLFCLVISCQNVLAEETATVPFFDLYTPEIPSEDTPQYEKMRSYYLQQVAKSQEELDAAKIELKDNLSWCENSKEGKDKLLCLEVNNLKFLMVQSQYSSNFVKYLFADNRLQKQKLWELQKKLNLYTQYLKDPKKAKYD